ncbi:MAG: DegT/DnrJ/EryC1/StrS family aminotransferase, partial [Holosporales bacterium]|nr:DegT/DnrJ/EryC1/StrS family aminotransferase [Holosporales bacterium]
HTFFKREDSKVTCVHSCSAALQLSLQACGVKCGDEVLVPNTCLI